MWYDNPNMNRNIELVLQYPFKFSCLENGLACVKGKCALWLPIQKACSLQVIARGIGISERK